MDLESQRTRKASTQGEALVAALDAYLEKHDPLLKAERARDRELKKVACQTSASGNPAEFNVDSNALRFENSVPSNAPAPVTGHTNSPTNNKRTKLPAHIQHALDLRDGCQCTHIDEDGDRCEERRWLDSHHIIAKELGGPDTLENLTTLCSGHHRLTHFEDRPRGPSSVHEARVTYH